MRLLSKFLLLGKFNIKIEDEEIDENDDRNKIKTILKTKGKENRAT